MNMPSGRIDAEHALATDGFEDGDAKVSLLDRMSVARKLNFAILGSTIVLALVAAIMVLGTAQLGAAGQHQTILASAEVRSNNTAIALADASRDLDQVVAGESGEALASARSHFAFAYAALTDPIEFAGEAMPDDIGPQLHSYRDQVAALSTRLGESGNAPADVADIRGETEQLYADISFYAVELHGPVGDSAERLFKTIRTTVILFILLVVGGVLISLFGARRIVRNITSAIAGITDAMNLVAAGHTDTPIPGRERKDEIGAMARALTVFRRTTLDLEGLDAARADAAEQALEIAREREDIRKERTQVLGRLADGFEGSIVDVTGFVADASVELKQTASNLAAAAGQSSKLVSHAAHSMDATSRNVSSAAAASDEFALSISEISKQASSSAELARSVQLAVEGANERISGLTRATGEISEIAGLIQSIASRTNLLALNASIEAARGGEAGRGFAVVASEVKELASRTSEATASVASRVGAIQSATESSAQDLASITDGVARLEQAAAAIASAVDQQSLSGQELARNIDDVAVTSREVAQTLEEVRSASEAAGAAANLVLNSSGEMQLQAEALRDEARNFLSRVREANTAS